MNLIGFCIGLIIIKGLDNNINNNDYFQYYYYYSDTTAIRPIKETTKERKKIIQKY